jgi:hypothetical protein
MEEFDIRIDKKRNIFYCILKGFFLESEIELALDRISDELSKLSDGYDVILDIQDLKTNPDFMKELLYEELIHLTKSDSRYIFNVDQSRNRESLKKSEKSIFGNLKKIRVIFDIQEANDIIERDYLLKNIFYN